MSKALLTELASLRTFAAQHTERWSAVGREIHDDTRAFVGTVQSAGFADYVCRLHNSFLPLYNLIVTLRKKSLDRSAMEKEINGE